MSHWVIYSAMPGYLPEGEILVAENLRTLAAMVGHELELAAESEGEAAEALAKAEDYKAAWFKRKDSDNLHNAAEAFSREWDAPIFRDNPDKIEESIRWMMGHYLKGDESGGQIDIGKHTKLYVEKCAEKNCEHLEDDE